LRIYWCPLLSLCCPLFVHVIKEHYWIRFFTIAISFITWKSRLWLAYCHFLFTLFVTDFYGRTAWKFTIDMLKSYSVEIHFGRDKSLLCTAPKFPLNKLEIYILSKLTLVKMENNFCQNGSSPCTAWKVTFGHLWHDENLLFVEIHFGLCKSLLCTTRHYIWSLKYIFCQYYISTQRMFMTHMPENDFVKVHFFTERNFTLNHVGSSF
jgi:hypothetical protein